MPDGHIAAGSSEVFPTILVADDNTLARSGIKLLVSALLGDVRFVEADNGDALMSAVHWHPEIRLALIDLDMGAMHAGLRLVELSRRRPTLPLVVVSASASADKARRVMNIPTVCAFVPKNADVASIRTAIEAALHGRRVTVPELQMPNRNALTPRQEEVHRLLSQGMSNKMIAGALGISEGTVKNHVSEIFRTLNTTNRTQAAQLLYGAQ